MGALFWVLRVLALLLIIRIVVRVVSSAMRRSRESGGQRPGVPGAIRERAGGELVRCETCGTYIPRSNAITSGSGTGLRHFCSTACRESV